MNEAPETALRRTLRDIHQGHLGLWVLVHYFDPTTGRRLATPRVGRVTPDRQPCAGIPNRSGEWWTQMVDRGWLALPPEDSGQRQYLVTEEGRRVVAQFEEATRL